MSEVDRYIEVETAWLRCPDCGAVNSVDVTVVLAACRICGANLDDAEDIER